jgi:hypothetical protein
MPESPSNRPPQGRRREELEARLLAELRDAEAAFHRASPDEKPEAENRYRQALERFNEIIVHRRMPPGSAEGT